MEAGVRHLRDGDEIDAEVQREHGEDLVTVHLLTCGIDREHAVAVAVEGEPEVGAVLADDARDEREIGRSTAVVDARPRGTSRSR